MSDILTSDMTNEALHRALIDARMIEPTAQPMTDAANDRPWFVTLLLGASGWLAGLFAILFVGLLFKPSGFGGWLSASIVTFLAAYGLYAAGKESAFFDQLALAFAVTAQVAFVGALANVYKSSAAIAAIAALMQCAVVLVMPNRFVKMLSTIFACIAWSLAVSWAWWGEGRILGLAHSHAPPTPAVLTWLVIWVPVMALTFVLIKREPHWMALRWRAVFRPVLTGLLLTLSLGTWQAQTVSLIQSSMGEGRADNWLVLWPLLSMGAALFALLAAFYLRHRAAMGVAILGVLLNIAHFYYLLGTTLLVKSLIMIAIGLSMLVGAWRMSRPEEMK